MKEKNIMSHSIRASTMRIKQANSIKREKLEEFQTFYREKFQPTNQYIMNMIERTPKEHVPTQLKAQF